MQYTDRVGTNIQFVHNSMYNPVSFPDPKHAPTKRCLMTIRHFALSCDIDVWNVGWPIGADLEQYIT